MSETIVIGGGLAGCEAALQLSARNVKVKLFEMRPQKMTPAHRTKFLAELVCSNSFKSQEPNNGHGLLKAELRLLNSFLLDIAGQTKIPAGKSLAVNREQFAKMVTRRIDDDINIEIVHDEVIEIPESPCVIASGPLTSDTLATKLRAFLGTKELYFYDAIAPIINSDSIDFSITFRGSRYGVDESYVNCPMNKEDYDTFCNALSTAKIYPLKEFEDAKFFEGCMPIEELLKRGKDTLRYGPLKPVGFNKKYYAILQLRSENQEGAMYSLVGCQTKMTVPEQERVFRLVPGLKKIQFFRYGSVHRNTYVNAPEQLLPTLQTKKCSDFFLAGQITGGEGYVESIATGLLAGINLARHVKGEHLIVPPQETMLGGLMKYLTTPNRYFAPMNANFGLIGPQKNRTSAVEVALNQIKEWIVQETI